VIGVSDINGRPDDAGPVVTLSVVEGPSRGKKYRYAERATAIAGRADDCDPLIEEPESKPVVSRHHCLFDINPPDIRVRDFGSLNGTHLNGELIGRREEGQTPEEGAKLVFRERDLADGDRITLGNTVLQVTITVPPKPKASESTPPVCSVCGDPMGKDSRRTGGDPVCARCEGGRAAAIEALLSRLVAGELTLPAVRGYDLVKKLGDGGFGVVYLARHQDTGELVALKMMLASAAVDDRAEAKFQREISNVEALDHPNIVSFREAGRAGAAFFFTSEYCAGGSIDQLIAREGLLDPERAVAMVQHVLAGLHYAHHAPLPNGVTGLVHRDIKPANLLLADTGSDPEVKVADFGLAKAFDRAGLSGMSMTGEAAGTTPFMARPQLINYKYAKPDVDVWATAAALYFMLTGKAPRHFPRGQDPVRVILDTTAVPIRERDPKIPKRLAKVIDEALIDKPKITVTSAAEFSAALSGAL
jgi:hypothetical protein